MATSSDDTGAESNGMLDCPSHLRRHLQRMRDDESSHDVVFVVNGQRFQAHRCYVAAVSPVLRRMLTNGMKETSKRDIVLKELEVEPWKAVLDYMYTGQMNLSNVNKALEYLKCAHWLLMEELVDAITGFIERKLDKTNCFEILVAKDHPSLSRLRKMAMKTIAGNFHDLWCHSGFIDLPFDVALEILGCDELVVRSELDIFLAATRWIVWSGVSGMSVMAEKTCKIIAEHTGVHLSDFQVLEADTYNEGNYKELFECVDIDKLSNADLQMVAVICRKLLKEAESDHQMNLFHVREFREKIVEKLTHSDLSRPSFPIALLKRVSHHRNDMVFTFSHRFDISRLELAYLEKISSPWQGDKRWTGRWCIEMRLGEKKCYVPGRYLSIYLHEARGFFKGVEESAFSDLVYAEVEGSEIFARTTIANSARRIEGERALVYHNLIPSSVLDLEDNTIINVAIVLYFKAK